MRVVHFITSLKIGGAEAALYNLLKNFDHTQNEHIIIYFYMGENFNKIKQLGIKTYKIDGLISIYDPFALIKILLLIKKLKPDVLHTALWSANILGRIVAKLLNIPVICDYHGNVSSQSKLRNLLEQKTIKIPTYFVAVSKSVKKDFEETLTSKCNKKLQNTILQKLILIQNGIDMDSIMQQICTNNINRKSFGFDENDFVIGTVGRLEPIKSYNILLLAFAEFIKKLPSENHTNIKLCIVGGGSEMENLKKLAEKLNIAKNIYFTGMQANSFNFYPNFDCFALSSQSEGLSIALLEALSFGLPIITTHSNTEHDVIVNGKNGFLIKINDFKDLAEKLFLLYYNPNLKNRMKAENIALANRNFDIKASAKLFESLYQKAKRS
ncbi:TPA: hypothetical protein DEO28_04650 [Candidatus Dependentiae bacterium]|nr:MAG: hypothetical protein UR14_C0002G0048 [candidate division TM6 bacterium GW2011_GWE2_31_21]KKP53845.1 MAG: hypothetical protein UR43_C0002G0048 [candidate division TM6 bacterium GW2011_GWF2_33_332]HBS47624.1 hypothetical protein [Candidatus Dependentiae bacterium]HBZ73773.1 hypothetical protein [Candidatus Dependentiae bacterium]